IANRPMWFVCQTAAKVPSCATVACVVGSHVQPVLGPERSISTVSPASRDGTEPENRRPLRSRAEARVETVIPSPLAVTTMFPWVGMVPAPLGEAPPLGPIVPPPEDAAPAAGKATAIAPAHAATV